MRKIIRKRSDILDNDFMLQKNEQEYYFYDICFCPFCRMLFLEESDIEIKNEDVVLDVKKNIYNCNGCDKTFTIKDLKNQTNLKHKSYKLPKQVKSKGTTSKHIKEIVSEYYKKGYSYRRIHELTCFSIKMIQDCLKTKESYDKEIKCSKKTLLEEHLKISKDDTLVEKINKALSFGCTYKVIEKLFDISSKTISKNRSQDIVISKNKITIENKQYKIRKKID